MVCIAMIQGQGQTKLFIGSHSLSRDKESDQKHLLLLLSSKFSKSPAFLRNKIFPLIKNDKTCKYRVYFNYHSSTQKKKKGLSLLIMEFIYHGNLSSLVSDICMHRSIYTLREWYGVDSMIFSRKLLSK